jgi:hypothetical protein
MQISIRAILFVQSIVCCWIRWVSCNVVTLDSLPATVSAQLAQIAGPRRLKLTIVPSAEVEL